MPPLAPLTTVLFDIDGTLLDSNEAHALSWAQTLRRHDHPVDVAQIRPLIGIGSDKLLAALLGPRVDEALAKRLVDERRELFLKEHLPRLQPTPGARALLDRLRQEGFQLVCATSAGGEELQALLRQAGVQGLFDDAATSSDAAQSKPDPDIVQAALRKAGVTPAQAVLVGDTPHDIEAARAAQVDTIALRCGGCWSDDALSGAVAVYDHPDDLLRHLGSSPLGQGAGLRSRPVAGSPG